MTSHPEKDENKYRNPDLPGFYIPRREAQEHYQVAKALREVDPSRPVIDFGWRLNERLQGYLRERGYVVEVTEPSYTQPEDGSYFGFVQEAETRVYLVPSEMRALVEKARGLKP